MKTISSSPRKERPGFTLIELLIVMSVVGFLLAMTAPGMFGIMQANDLSTQGEKVKNQLSLAQQTAVSTNQDIEVRFFKFSDFNNADGDPQIRAMQFYRYDALDEDPKEYDNQSSNLIPTSEIFRLHGSTIIVDRPSHTNIFSTESGSTKGTLSAEAAKTILGDGVQSAEYFAFRFKANGSVTLKKRSRPPFFFTMASEDSLNNPRGILNYYSIQIDPYNGSIRHFRPEAE